MAGIPLTDPQRSELLAALLRKQDERPQIRSGIGLGLRLGAQALRQKKINKLNEQEAASNQALVDALNSDDPAVALADFPIEKQVLAAQLQNLKRQGVKQPETKLQTFGDSDGAAKKTTVVGTPEFFAAVENPDLFPIGNISQLQRTKDVTPQKTETQVGKNIVDFEDAAVGGIGAIQTGLQLLKIGQETPEALGKPGAIFRFGSEMIALGSGLGKMFGVDVSPNRDIGSFSFDGFTGNLQKVAVESSRFRSGIYGIAFAAAVAEQGTRPTDKDIQQFIDQIAGNSSSFPAFAGTINDFMHRIARRLRNTAKIKGIPKKAQDRILPQLDDALADFDSFFSDAKEQRLKELGL